MVAVQLQDAGRNALAFALANTTTITMGSFRVGDTSPVTLSPTATDIQGTLVYTGPQGDIGIALQSPNEVKISLSMDTNVGDFDVGNFMVFLDDSTPFVSASLEGNPIEKVATNSPTTVGNLLIVNMVIVFQNDVSAGVTVNVTPVVFADLPSTATELTIPAAGTTCFDNYNVQDHTAYQRPTLAMRQTTENEWYAAMYQRLDNAEFGQIGGGPIEADPFEAVLVHGGSYFIYPVTEIIGGLLFTDTPTSTIDGGSFV